MFRNFEDIVKTTTAIVPIVATSDQTGTAVDCSGYTATRVVYAIGISGDTLSGSVYTELELQESDLSGSGFAACPNTALSVYVTGTNTGTVAKIDAAAEDPATHIVEYRGTKRYIKPIINVTGTHSNGTPVCVIVEQAGAKTGPAA